VASAAGATAEGLNLHLNPQNPTGYRCVVAYKNKYRVKLEMNGVKQKPGVFDTALDAAVFYARHMNRKGVTPSFL